MSRELFRGEQVIMLSPMEFQLLRAFVDHPGVVLNRESLLALTSAGQHGAGERSIDTGIARLRHKMEAFDGNLRLIKTARGGGYIFAAEIQRA